MASKSTPLAPQDQQSDYAAPEMVYVVAPATLPEGYTFEAQIGGDENKAFDVTVPSGGVKEGQEFLAPLPTKFNGPRIVAPSGDWKDGLCDWWKLGPFHAHLVCAACCTQLAMAQVMRRMWLNWLGSPETDPQSKKTYKVVLVLVIAYFIYTTSLEIAAPAPSDENDPAVPAYIAILKALGNIVFTFYSIYALMKTREAVRKRYSIPEKHCVGYEDLCCSCFCSCCTVAQMMRHTGEYETYNAVCCSERGHGPTVPYCV